MNTHIPPGQGNDAFRKQAYDEAIHFYSEAMNVSRNARPCLSFHRHERGRPTQADDSPCSEPISPRMANAAKEGRQMRCSPHKTVPNCLCPLRAFPRFLACDMMVFIAPSTRDVQYQKNNPSIYTNRAAAGLKVDNCLQAEVRVPPACVLVCTFFLASADVISAR